LAKGVFGFGLLSGNGPVEKHVAGRLRVFLSKSKRTCENESENDWGIFIHAKFLDEDVFLANAAISGKK
jgi:hypothetical protein